MIRCYIKLIIVIIQTACVLCPPVAAVAPSGASAGGGDAGRGGVDVEGAQQGLEQDEDVPVSRPPLSLWQDPGRR